jgi:glycerol 2-dehydrogenase (NADP+)
MCQVQLHPCLPDKPLLDYCKQKNILLTAYSPLGQVNSPFFKDETCLKVAEKNGVTVGQVILSWAVQRGTVVIPKSAKEERLKQNFTVSPLFLSHTFVTKQILKLAVCVACTS